MIEETPMSTIELELVNQAESRTVEYDGGWKDTTYRCHIALIKDEDGYSAVVLNLPGAGSCGATEEEAIDNAKEAVLGVVESYLDANQDIPWQDPTADSIPQNASLKWIIVNA